MSLIAGASCSWIYGGALHGESALINSGFLSFRGQYSDAVLSSLESQNDSEIEGISAKVKMLKDVCHLITLLHIPA
jgi:hypothetical protein